MPTFKILDNQTLEERATYCATAITPEGKCYCRGGENASCMKCYLLSQLHQVQVETAKKVFQEFRNMGFEHWTNITFGQLKELKDLEKLLTAKLELPVRKVEAEESSTPPDNELVKWAKRFSEKYPSAIPCVGTGRAVEIVVRRVPCQDPTCDLGKHPGCWAAARVGWVNGQMEIVGL